MELADYVRILRTNWLLIVAITLLGVGAAAGWSLTQTPAYQATSQVFVSTQGGGTIAELQQGSSFSQARVTTYVALASTPIVLNPVIARLGLEDTSSADLAQQVSASSPVNTTIVSITVTDADPVRAADIANAIGAGLTAAVAQIETLPGSDASPVKLTRVKDATPAFAPVSPNVPLIVALGGILALALGIGLALLRSVLDTRIRLPRDVEQVTDRPIIGAVPFDPKTKDRPIILHADPRNPRSESFRSLRTNLQFLDMDGSHSFVVTSSVPGEGKSTTAVNLAIALADAGKRVALVDADLRKPKVASYLQIEGGVGLTDVLIGRARLADVMLQWGDRSLYVLPAGSIPPNPSELLGSVQMQELLKTLSAGVDVVIFDTPPLLPVTDAAVLAKYTSGAIVIVATGATSRHQLESAIDALGAVGAHIAGMVLTMMPTRGPNAYGYGYGYGYGYAEAKPKSAWGARGRKKAPAAAQPEVPAAAQPEAPPVDRTTSRRVAADHRVSSGSSN